MMMARHQPDENIGYPPDCDFFCNFIYAITSQPQPGGCHENDSLMPHYIMFIFISCFVYILPPGKWVHPGWFCTIIVRLLLCSSLFSFWPSLPYSSCSCFCSYGIFLRLTSHHITRLHPVSLCFVFSVYIYVYVRLCIDNFYAPKASFLFLFDSMGALGCGGWVFPSFPMSALRYIKVVHKYYFIFT